MASNEGRNLNVPDEIRAKFGELEADMSKIIDENITKSLRPKIQRVPEFTGHRFESFYLPKLVSIGPIHCDKFLSQPGTKYKGMWTAMYLKDTHQTVFDLFQKIFKHYRELSTYFSKDLHQQLLSQETPIWFAWTLAMDGCMILQLLDKSDHSVDPEQELRVSIDKLVQAHQDLLLLENQIPFQVLRLLCNDEAKLKKCLHNFLQVHGINKTSSMTEKEPEEHKVIVETLDQYDDDPVHLLDYLRRALLIRDQRQFHTEIKINRKSLRLRKYRIGTIMELKAAGIHVRKDPNDNSFYPSFSDGQLELPELTVHGSTGLIFFNLIAYEMCPDFCNNLEISSYITFLSSLVDQPEDVKELRIAGILVNELGSDKAVADLFNKIDSVLVPQTARFAHTRDQIHFFLESKQGKIKMLGSCEDESPSKKKRENSKERF